MSETSKNKHLTLQERIEIQECLSHGMTFKAIAQRVEKNPTTVSREVRNHMETFKKDFTRTNDTCPKLLHAPFVCNGCSEYNRRSCIYPRRMYIALHAQSEYRNLLTEAREGTPLSKESFYQTEKVISDGVKAGQHIYQILRANDLPISKSTVYRHIHRGYYSVIAVDLPRVVKFKPRAKHAPEYVPRGIRQDRAYSDYLAYIQENPDINVTEMDTVIGRIGGKVIMTFQITKADFMFGLLLENKTAGEAAEKIITLKQKLKDCGFSFGDIFPVLLTDNGGEFSCVSAFEDNVSGEKETSVFFCDPNAPYQKPHVENNHTLFRSIVPGGTSFDNFTQETVNMIFSHINGVLRKSFNGKSAYEMFCFTYSEALAQALGIYFVEPRKVIQSPLLLK